MKNSLKSALTALSLLASSVASAENVGGVEFSFAEDKKEWKLEKTFENEKGSTSIYIPAEETLEMRHEAFATFVTQEVSNFDNIHEVFPSLLGHFFPNMNVTFTILQNDGNSLLAEWVVEEEIGPKEKGVTRLICTANGTVMLAYSTNQFEQFEVSKQNWLTILNNASVID